MAPSETPSSPSLAFECSTCHRMYAKKEHLQRHERTHTGVRPFACQLCHRTFARQDALNRHVKTHRGLSNRSDLPQEVFAVPDWNTIPAGGPTNLDDGLGHGIPPPGTGLHTSPLNGISSSAAELPIQQFENGMASSLIWPDSEDFLQSLMSLDSNIWDSRIGWNLPVADFPHQSPFNEPIRQSVSSFDPGTTGDEGHRAVQTLNGLISNTLSSVVTTATLSDMTSRFLDGCLHSFFTVFLPMLPVIHRPTFEFRECSPPLLLNIIALGSIFVGTPDATVKGEAVWRIAHTAVATSWHLMITQKQEYDRCCGVELILTALLSQTYAALSQNKTLRMTSQIFHGLSTYWARYCGLYDLQELQQLPSPEDPPDTKIKAWKMWSARESQLRILLGLNIVDGVVSQFSGSSAFASHISNPLPLPSSDAAFSAESAEKWLQVASREPLSRVRFCDLVRLLFREPYNVSVELSIFDVKVVLETVNSLIHEFNHVQPPPIGLPTENEILSVLMEIRGRISSSGRLSSTERAIGLLRWHALCLDLAYNTARGARRLCYLFGITQHIFGGQVRQEHDVNPARWLEQKRSRKCLLHALQIQQITSQLPLGLAYDLYVPGAIFAAAATYIALAFAGISKVTVPTEIDWYTVLFCESDMMDSLAPSSLGNTGQYTTKLFLDSRWTYLTEPCEVRNLSYDLNTIRNLLRGLSLQWGVAKEMEHVVEAWMARCG